MDTTDSAHRVAWNFGTVAAAYVTIPAIPDTGARSFVLIAAIATTIALAPRFGHATGVRPADLGARAWGVVLAALVATLLAISVAFGLVASDLEWWIVLPAAAAFAAVTWLVGQLPAAARTPGRR